MPNAVTQLQPSGCSYLHARLGGAYGPARSTGMVRATGQTHLALPLVALAGPEQRPLEGDVGLISPELGDFRF